MHITVYLGSKEGNSSIYKRSIKDLGAWIGKNGHTLIYGGSKSGLMGALAGSVLDHGGKVIGIEPQYFVDAGLEFKRLTELIITDTMAERKTKMMELGDVFIAFPGGLGTLEELSEFMTLYNIGRINKPYAIYNLNGYYEPLKVFLNQMVETGFLTANNRDRIKFVDNLEDIKKWIGQM